MPGPFCLAVLALAFADKIEHGERISRRINDQLTIDRTKELVRQMKALKVALHSEQEM